MPVIMIMKNFSKILYVLMILYYITMTIVTANGTFSTSTEALKINTIEQIEDQSANDSSFNEHMHKTDTFVTESTDNGGSVNANISDLVNSTEKSNSEAIHSSFNIATIPTVAVFLFIIVACIKCCKWFRQYSRGGNKDDHIYAVIVTDDDKEYGHIDITSDTTSTACYDTVSSFSSFLKRSGNESTLSYIRAWHQDSIKSTSSTSSATAITKKTINCGSNKPLTASKNSRAKLDDSNSVRISSTSSADTISEQFTDSPAIRRNKFRVSFETKTKESTSVKTPVDNISNNKSIRSSLKKPPTEISHEPKMVDVGTQTNKSFRYSLCKSKPHVNNNDIDETLLASTSTNTSESQSKECQRKGSDSDILSQNSDENRLPHVNHSSVSLEKHKKNSHPTLNPEISKYPFHTNVEVIHHSEKANEPNEDVELDDDVFTEKGIKDSTPLSYQHQQFDKNASSEQYDTAKEKSEGKLLEGVKLKPKIHLCNQCKTRLDRNTVDTICDEGSSQVSNIIPVIQKMCENCSFGNIHTQNVSCTTEDDERYALPLQNQCQLIEINERPSSTISLESSGYAELSSSESNSSLS